MTGVKEVFTKKLWMFGLRIAIGVASLSAFGLVATTRIDMDIRAMWSTLTFVFVSQPSLGTQRLAYGELPFIKPIVAGATINKGVQRAVGTLFGAIAGQLVRESIANFGVPDYPSVAILLASLGLFGFISNLAQHPASRSQHYPYLVAFYAFQVILLSGVNSVGAILVSGGWTLAFLRFAHVIIGDVYSTVVGLVFSDRSTSMLLNAVDDMLTKMNQLFPKLVLHDPSQNISNKDSTVQSLLPQLRVKKQGLRNMLNDCRQEVILRPGFQSILDQLVQGLEIITDHLFTLHSILGKSGWTQHHTNFVAPCLALVDQLQHTFLSDMDQLRLLIKANFANPPQTPQSSTGTDLENGNSASSVSISANLDKMAALIREIDETRAQIVSSTRRQRIWHQFANSELVRWNAFLHILRDTIAVWSKLRQPTSRKAQ